MSGAVGPAGRVPLRTGSLRMRTVVSVLGMLTVLLVALGFTVQLVLGERLRTQIEERLQDRASAATALMGTVDSDDLAQRLSAEGVSVRIQSADGAAVVAGPTPDQLRTGPGAGLAPVGVGEGPASAGSDAPVESAAGATSGSSSDAATSAEGGAAPDGAAPAPAAAPEAAADPAAPAAATTPTVTASTFTSDAQIVTLETSLSDGTTLTLTADASSVEQTLVQLRWVMAGASVVFLLVAAGALVVVVRASLAPLESMTAVARSIARGDRGQRLRPQRTDTEIGRVALAFDEMLDGVEGAERTALASEQGAREAEERVRNFVSDAAHELRTPVAGMQAAADTLVRASVDRTERDRLASHVVREAGRASRLIDDMLMMARVDRGLELERRPTDVARMVADEAERQRIRRPALRLDVDLPGGPVIADVDPERLAQVVANLVDNASRMTGGAGPVSIRVACEPAGAMAAGASGGALADHGSAVVQAAAARGPGGVSTASGSAFRGDGRRTASRRQASLADGVFVRIEVSDAGPGVPEAERERIFDRLVRLDDSRRAGAGAGLGLPIARGIARAHGGDLTCEPEGVATARGAVVARPGARFVMTLPG